MKTSPRSSGYASVCLVTLHAAVSYFSSVYEPLKNQKKADPDMSAFFTEDESWPDKYKKGKLRAERVNIYAKMDGFTTL